MKTVISTCLLFFVACVAAAQGTYMGVPSVDGTLSVMAGNAVPAGVLPVAPTTNVCQLQTGVVCYGGAVGSRLMLSFIKQNANPRLQLSVTKDSFTLKVNYPAIVCGHGGVTSTTISNAHLSLNKGQYAIGDTVQGYFDCYWRRRNEYTPATADTVLHYFKTSFTTVVRRGKHARKVVPR